LGATIISEKIYQVISQPQCDGGVFSMGFTYSGHATACAAALKNFEILEKEQLFENVNKLGPYLQQQAREALGANPIVGDVRGIGFMLGIDLVADKETKQSLNVAQLVFEKCLKRGLIIRPVASIIVISPPLTLTKENIDTLLLVLKQSLTEVALELTKEQN
jgi:adenosylmethionine-8-amino-7-oxononanoate aminotransferase